jgi:hypothetical protein
MWIAEFWQVINGLLSHPTGSFMVPLYRVIGFLVMMFVFEYVGDGMGANKQIGLVRCFLALAVGMLVVCVGYAVTDFYILPALPKTSFSQVILMVVTALIVLVVGVPLQCLLRKSKYVAMAVAFGASLLAVFLVMFALTAMLGSLRAGGRRSDSIRDRKHETERMIAE